MILASLALAAAVPPPLDLPDRAGSRVTTLSMRGPGPWEPGEGSALYCSEAPRWCVSWSRDDDLGWTLSVSNAAISRGAQFRLPAPDRPGARLAIWPHLIRGADGSVLAGALRTEGGAYSGGGWRAVHLVLVRVTPEAEAIVLDMPIETSASIRACFDERDRRRRRDACTDDYAFAASLLLDTGNTTLTPVLRVTTLANTYPGRRTRTDDSSEGGPLHRQDLIRWRDPVCSYVRHYRLDAAEGRYLPESPVPACTDYLDFE